MFHPIIHFLRLLVMALDFTIVCSFTFICACLPRWINRRFMPALFSHWCWSFVRFLGVECHIHQKFKPPLPDHFLLVSNHPSGLDILLLNAIFRVRPLAKEEIKSWWILGRIARSVDTVFVKREERESRHAAKQGMVDAIQSGANLLIYPEGGCFGKHLRPFKYGAFEISMTTGIPILPVYMQYEAENDIEWGEYGLIHHIYNILRACNKHAHCYIFDPVQPQGFSDAQSYSRHLHEWYEKWEARYRLPGH